MVTDKTGMDPLVGIPYMPVDYDQPTNGTEWNDPNIHLVLVKELFNTSFWLISSVILVNLLIAVSSPSILRSLPEQLQYAVL